MCVLADDAQARTEMEKNIIYKAEYGWRGKILSLLGVCILSLVLIKDPEFLIRFWQDQGWILRACGILTLVVLILVPLESFIERTAFTDTFIEHRSMFGLKLTRTYSRVKEIFMYGDFLEIQFKDGKKVTIWRAKGDLAIIASIIQKQAGKSIPVV